MERGQKLRGGRFDRALEASTAGGDAEGSRPEPSERAWPPRSWRPVTAARGSQHRFYLLLSGFICFALLSFADNEVFFFLQIEGLGQLCLEQVCWHHLSNSICSLWSHFDNSPNISSIFIIIVFVMAACNQ